MDDEIGDPQPSTIAVFDKYVTRQMPVMLLA